MLGFGKLGFGRKVAKLRIHRASSAVSFQFKLFVELSRPRPDFIDILAPTDASSADVDWIKAELSRADRYPSSFKIANTSSRATRG